MTTATVMNPAKIAKDLQKMGPMSFFRLLKIRNKGELKQATAVLEKLASIDDPNVEIFEHRSRRCSDCIRSGNCQARFR